MSKSASSSVKPWLVTILLLNASSINVSCTNLASSSDTCKSASETGTEEAEENDWSPTTSFSIEVEVVLELEGESIEDDDKDEGGDGEEEEEEDGEEEESSVSFAFSNSSCCS